MNALVGYMQGMEVSDAINESSARNSLTASLRSGDRRGAFNALAQIDPVAAYRSSQPDPAAQREAAAGLVKGVLAVAPEQRGQAWGAALQQAQRFGMDVSSVPQEYPGDEYATMMAGMFGMNDGERSEFERLSATLPPEQAKQALMVKLGLAPEAQSPNARLPASVQEYEYARQQGFTGSYDQFLGKKQPQTSVTVNGPNSDKFAERTGTILADEASATAQAGQAAMANLRSIDRLGALLDAAPTGGMAAIQQTLGEFGIPSEGLSDIQAAQALINKLVPEQRPPGTGPMSDADLALFKQSLPRIINTPDGNRKIIETLRAIASYDVQRGQIARKLQLGQIDPNEADAAWNALSNPLADFTAGERGPGTPIGGFNDIPPPQGVDPSDWQFMSPEDRALFQ